MNQYAEKKIKKMQARLKIDAQQIAEPLSFIQYLSCFFVIIMPLLFCKWNDQSPFEMIKGYFSAVSVSLIGVIYLLQLIWKDQIKIKVNIWVWGLLAYWLIYMLSFAFTGHVYSSLWGVLNLPAGSVYSVTTFVFFSFVVVQIFSNIHSLKTLAACFVFTAFLMSIYGIIQHFGGDPINWWVYDAMTSRALSTMGQSVGYGTVLGCCLPLCFAFLISSKDNKSFWFWLTAWTSMNLGILYSGSRLPIFAFFITMIIFTSFALIFKSKLPNISWKKFWIALAMIFVCNIAYFFEPGENALRKKLEVGEIQNGYSTRFIVWRTAIEMWKQHPVLGVGPENFGEEFNHIQTVEQNYGESWSLIWHKAHNEFIHYLATTGAVGFLAYIFLIGLMFVPVFRNLFKKVWPDDYVYSIALLGGFGFLLVTHLTAFSFIPTLMFFYLFPAMNFNFSGIHREYVFENNLFSRWKKLLSFFVAFVGLFLAYNVYQMWQADIDYNESRRQLISYGDIEKSYSHLNAAIANNSKNAEYWCFRADVYYNLFARSLRSQNPNMQQLEQERKGLFDEIIKSSDKCVSLDPRKADLWRARGTLFMTLSQFAPQMIEISFESYKKAIEVYPNNPFNYISLSTVFIKKGRIDLAIDALKTAIAKRNDLAPAYAELMKIYYKSGQKAEVKNTLLDIQKFIIRTSEFYLQMPNLIKIAEDNKDAEAVQFLRSL